MSIHQSSCTCTWFCLHGILVHVHVHALIYMYVPYTSRVFILDRVNISVKTAYRLYVYTQSQILKGKGRGGEGKGSYTLNILPKTRYAKQINAEHTTCKFVLLMLRCYVMWCARCCRAAEIHGYNYSRDLPYSITRTHS